MGGLLSGFYSKVVPYNPPKSLMVGLDNAGKTSILFKLKLGEAVQTIPTVGFNVESIQHKKLHLTIWDVGGQDKIRPLWRHYYSQTQVIIFVIDSNDETRIDDKHGCCNNAKKELHSMLSDDELQDIILLIYANKQDLTNSMNEMEITQRLDLENIDDAIKWKVQCASALTGDGLTKGLEWIYKQLKKKNKSKSKISKSRDKRKIVDLNRSKKKNRK